MYQDREGIFHRQFGGPGSGRKPGGARGGGGPEVEYRPVTMGNHDATGVIVDGKPVGYSQYDLSSGKYQAHHFGLGGTVSMHSNEKDAQKAVVAAHAQHVASGKADKLFAPAGFMDSGHAYYRE